MTAEQEQCPDVGTVALIAGAGCLFFVCAAAGAGVIGAVIVHFLAWLFL